MKIQNNTGFAPEVIANMKAKIRTEGHQFVWVEAEDNSDEYVHFQFVGTYDGAEVIYDAVMYTLRLQHESELFELAEHEAAKHFPHYKKITYEEDENGNLEKLDDLEEEIGLFMAEVILELEEEGEVKVKEHVDVDAHTDFGVGLDIGLHIEKITPRAIDQFIIDFNSGSLKLDPTLYSFQTQSEVTDR
jgi:hypothetical protein